MNIIQTLRSAAGIAMAAAVAAAAAALPSLALAQAPPSYDFDFATITDINNPPYHSATPQAQWLVGRGSVAYEYRMAKMEVTTSQWVEFVNAFTTQGSPWSHSFPLPTHWGAQLDASYSGPGYRWQVSPSVPNADRFYVGGISWRTAAMYCNWLHNDKAPEPWALENGAYDTSTFGPGSVGLTFTDQWMRNPEAKFWIPSLDEWIKAAHFDPNKYAPGQGGWWEYSYMSNEPPIPGPPGTGQTSGGYEAPGFWEVPLGAYPE